MTLTRRRRPLGLRTRFAVLEAGGFRCHYCGRPPGVDIRLQVDHVVSVSEGGANDPANLVASCTACNLGKADRPLAPACEILQHRGPFELTDFPTGDRALWCRPCRRVTVTLAPDGTYQVLG